MDELVYQTPAQGPFRFRRSRQCWAVRRADQMLDLNFAHFHAPAQLHFGQIHCAPRCPQRDLGQSLVRRQLAAPRHRWHRGHQSPAR